MVMAVVYDVTKQQKFLDAVSMGLDYLFGANPLNLSYITGHGENPSQSPHHRFWAFAADKNYPPAPPGALIGGPNQALEDSLAKKHIGHCVQQPATCYLDHINSWSTNEITINWNSGLAWITAFYNNYANQEI